MDRTPVVLDPESREPQAGCPARVDAQVIYVQLKKRSLALNETLLKHLLNLKMLESTASKELRGSPEQS